MFVAMYYYYLSNKRLITFSGPLERYFLAVMVKQTSKQASQGTSNKISTCNSIQSEAVVIFEETHPIRPNQSTHVFSGHTTVPDPEDSTHYISKDVIKTQCTLNINQPGLTT
ncbi:hypothetical protein Pst134EA_032201 [Puccinia striiformis f. sp. tritici]|uniref:uncharacterized protein n=1 Tax=Puccinia striiformis f. sp. tritici TaxID=168172 RepID=UPI0020083D33|nr:uncharacterized protein Pst134EA_032201 [Puccinia striiformis f. sp. tritici]KAH9440775.1 hypothetical protein Pst134EA_032201 [Puccinia striiformis f. sp. tritici]